MTDPHAPFPTSIEPGRPGSVWPGVAIGIAIGAIIASLVVIFVLNGPDDSKAVETGTSTTTTSGSAVTTTIATPGTGTVVADGGPVGGFCSEAALFADQGDTIPDGAGRATTEIRVTNFGMLSCVLGDQLEIVVGGDMPGGEVDPGRGGAEASVADSAGQAVFDVGDVVIGSGKTVAIDLVHEDGPPGQELGTANSVHLVLGDVQADVWDARLPFEVEAAGVRAAETDGAAHRTAFAPAAIGGGDAVSSTSVLSTGGLGVIRPGMTLQEAADATGQWVVEQEWEQATDQCGSAFIGGVEGVWLYLEGPEGRLDQATVVGVHITNPAIATPSGLRVGDAEAQIFAVLDRDRFEQFTNEYTGGNIWLFRDSDGERSVAFDIDPNTEQIVSIGGGTNPYRAEGCA